LTGKELIGDLKRKLARLEPASDDENALGNALLNHPRQKELRRFFSMKTAKFRGGLDKDDKDEARELCKELGLPCPK
jgi:hypothetical protein